MHSLLTLQMDSLITVVRYICYLLTLVRCRTCDREVVGSTPARGCYVPTPTQRAIPPGSVNEYQRKLGSKRAMHWPRTRGLAASAGVRLRAKETRPMCLKARERTLLYFTFTYIQYNGTGDKRAYYVMYCTDAGDARGIRPYRAHAVVSLDAGTVYVHRVRRFGRRQATRRAETRCAHARRRRFRLRHQLVPVFHSPG